jgi:hypothetical protein
MGTVPLLPKKHHFHSKAGSKQPKNDSPHERNVLLESWFVPLSPRKRNC